MPVGGAGWGLSATSGNAEALRGLRPVFTKRHYRDLGSNQQASPGS